MGDVIAPNIEIIANQTVNANPIIGTLSVVSASISTETIINANVQPLIGVLSIVPVSISISVIFNAQPVSGTLEMVSSNKQIRKDVNEVELIGSAQDKTIEVSKDLSAIQLIGLFVPIDSFGGLDSIFNASPIIGTLSVVSSSVTTTIKRNRIFSKINHSRSISKHLETIDVERHNQSKVTAKGGLINA